MKVLLIVALLSTLACAVYATEYPEIVATVGPNGQYSTLKSAYDYIAALPKNTSVRFVVSIEAGTYTEQLTIKRANVTFRASSTPVVIQFNSPRKTSGGANNATFTVDTNAVNFRMYDIDLVDIAPEVKDVATTALSIAAYNTSFYNCKILGFQDTLWFRNARSYGYFKNCYIEGGVDFIYGSGIAYFDSCTIASNRAGSVTAMQGATATALGTYVFNYCNIIATLPSGPLAALADPTLSYTSESQFARSCYLGRPWDQFSRVVYLFSKLGEHIALEGWTSWQVPAGQMYGEYNNTGRGTFNPARISTSTLLDSQQAVNYTFERFFDANPFWLDESFPPTKGAPQWGQCGGNYYTTYTACQAPFVCNFQSEWYSQCVAGPLPTPAVVDTTQVIYNQPVGDVASLSIANDVQGSVHWLLGAPGSPINVQAILSNVVVKNFIATITKASNNLKIATQYYGNGNPTVDLYVTIPSNLALTSTTTSLYNGTIDAFAVATSDACSSSNDSCVILKGTAQCEDCCAASGGVCTSTGCEAL